MKLLLTFAFCALCAAMLAGRQVSPGLDFARTMRVDYLHTGGPGGEKFSVDGASREGPWSGSQNQLIDGTDLGKYRFAVIDRASNRVIYSRGFASVYGEWETTPEFRTTVRTFHE